MRQAKGGVEGGGRGGGGQETYQKSLKHFYIPYSRYEALRISCLRAVW